MDLAGNSRWTFDYVIECLSGSHCRVRKDPVEKVHRSILPEKNSSSVGRKVPSQRMSGAASTVTRREASRRPAHNRRTSVRPVKQGWQFLGRLLLNLRRSRRWLLLCARKKSLSWTRVRWRNVKVF